MIVTALFGVLCISLFVGLNIPKLSWRIIHVQQIGVLIPYNSRKNTTTTSNFINNIIWPFFKLQVYSTEPITQELPTQTLTIGGSNQSLNVSFHGLKYRYRVFDPICAYFNSTDHEPANNLDYEYLRILNRVLSATTWFTIQAQGIGFIEEQVQHGLSSIAYKLGVELEQIFILDFDTPGEVIEASRVLLKAAADAEGIRATAQARADAYNIEHQAMGDDYNKVLNARTVTESSQNGAFRVFGGNINTLIDPDKDSK